MSSDEIAVRVSNLSKCYHIFDRPPDRLKHSIVPKLQRLIGRPPKQYYREFWALKDISFDVKKGETVGIIGRNGSGKSTLLQIICGTLAPTSGSVETNGRVAALLELGSGFNPEFTGRENVFMNGAVLGLSREEIEARFDAIAAFADVGDFIEQPVKMYSSGMVVRLAFSIIVNVNAEILIIDEALAVGDFVFTQKCMRYLREFMKVGTLMFVSHDMQAVMNLCSTAIWLENGILRARGTAKEICEDYRRACLEVAYGGGVRLAKMLHRDDKGFRSPNGKREERDSTTTIEFFHTLDRSGGWTSGGGEIISARLLDEAEAKLESALGGELVCLEIKSKALKELYSPIIGFVVKDRLGQALFGENTFLCENSPMTLAPGQVCTAHFWFTLPLLPNGEYSITVALATGTVADHVQHHRLYDAILLSVSSAKLRYGLIGIPFRKVSFDVD